MTPGTSVADTLTLNELPINQSREQVMPSATLQWASKPACSVERTGYGNNRRAWFLETCTFSNDNASTLHQETPETVSYHFLEGKLVQITVAFTGFDDQARFQSQIASASQQMEVNPSTLGSAAQLDNSGVLRVSHAIAKDVHVLQVPE